MIKSAFDFPDPEVMSEILFLPKVIARIEQSLERFALADNPRRTSVTTSGGELLSMAASSDRYFGAKLISVAPDNPTVGLPRIQGVYVAFDTRTSSVAAVLEASALTLTRTAAFTAWATGRMARPEASRLLVYGAGPQARAHIDAVSVVRGIEEIKVISRSVSSAETLANELVGRGLTAGVGTVADQSWADIICCCTSSALPVIEGARLRAGVHVNAVGSHRPDHRELDGATMGRARIAVETRESALAEAGDILLGIADGAMTADDIEFDLVELRRAGPLAARGSRDITVFKSVGVAFEDLLVAEMVAEQLGDQR